ncbi:ACT domain-containing protein [Thermoleophilia bacterium SCSIO 60948]|nr:ACT domain-containing protein [Thermoleophilia bacterium SCSIO 60948]
MPLHAVTAIGRDRPGIVAALTRELLALDANLADSRMAIMRGHFAVMLIAEVPDASREGLASALERVKLDLDLEHIGSSPISDDAPERPEPTHVLSVYGADHPGIVSAVTEALAANDVNVTGLETRLVGPEADPIYAMLLELELGGLDAGELATALDAVASEQGLELSLSELDSEAL